MKIVKIACCLGIVGLCAVPAMAHGHHRHHHNDGIRLAANVVGLVGAVVKPAPVIVTQPAVVAAPAPVVVAPPPPAPVVVTPPRHHPVRHYAPAPRHHRGHHGPVHHRGRR